MGNKDTIKNKMLNSICFNCQDATLIIKDEFDRIFRQRLETLPPNSTSRKIVDSMWPFMMSLEYHYGADQARVVFWKMVNEIRLESEVNE